MLLNVIIGLVIPWFFGALLYKKATKIILIISPFGGILAHIVNSIQYKFEFWTIKPESFEHLNYLIYDIGLYGVLSAFLIYLIHRKNVKPILAILTFTLLTTLLEYIGVAIERIVYFNGWNIFFTFWSYLIPYIFVYLYYILLSRKNLITKRN